MFIYTQLHVQWTKGAEVAEQHCTCNWLSQGVEARVGSILCRDPEMKQEVQRGLGWERKPSETLRGPELTTAHHCCAQEPSLLTLYSHPGGSLSCYLDLPRPCLRGVSHGHCPELPKATSVAQRTYALLWALGHPLDGDKTLSQEVILFSLHSPPPVLHSQISDLP